MELSQHSHVVRQRLATWQKLTGQILGLREVYDLSNSTINVRKEIQGRRRIVASAAWRNLRRDVLHAWMFRDFREAAAGSFQSWRSGKFTMIIDLLG